MTYNFEPCEGWWDFTYDDAKAIGGLMGIEIDSIYFSGFCHQGQGACFEGSLSYRKGCVAAVASYAPQDRELQAIARRWQDLMRSTFYRATGSVRHRGRYQHEYCTEFSWHDCTADQAEDLTDCARDFMRWIYRQLESEHDYQRAWLTAHAWQESRENLATVRQERRALVRDLRAARRQGMAAASTICAALLRQVNALKEECEALAADRDRAKDAFWFRDREGKAWTIEQFTFEHV